MWGSATAAYQVEGAAQEGGRSPSIWDAYCAVPGNIVNGESGAVACDHYHRYKEDIKIMRDLGLPYYRFSIAWTRVLPKGRGEPNPEGIKFYNSLIDELVANGIKPVVTLYHWDLPQCLDEEYGGWLGRQVIADFEHYAATCFEHFGDRVGSWITFNEPWCSAVLGYANGEMAPGHKSDAGREPYQASHNILLSHAHAVRRYRTDFQEKQRGVIGITLNVDWRESLTDKQEDKDACQRALDWMLGWYADPVWKGDYPENMKGFLGDRLPKFTEEEKALVKDSSDFFGLNHYTTGYITAPEGEASTLSMWGNVQSGGYFADQNIAVTDDPLWKRTDMDWAVVPWGLKKLCAYVQERYHPRGGIIITENGTAVREDTVEAAINDKFRVEYLQGYIAQMHQGIQEGVDIRGYFAWSLLDNFEWGSGYSKRFGMVRVDYTTQERTVKNSGKMFSEVVKTNALVIPQDLLEASNYKFIKGDGLAATKDSPNKKKAAELAADRLTG
jgi:beta-galactosidase